MLFPFTDKRTVVHLDLDTFFVSVERLQNNKLIGKPIIIGGTSDRGVVASCSYEARAFGVHSAMPMKLARMLCPQAVYIRGDMDSYSKYSKIVTEIIEERSPLVEKASIDEHYIDISGMDKFFGCLKWTHELRERIMKESGLPISFGLSSNKTVSKVASGEKQIERGAEKIFLAPLSIKKIPGIGDVTFRELRGMGIERVQMIQEMPVELMQKVLGDNGITIWKKSNGIDNTPVLLNKVKLRELTLLFLYCWFLHLSCFTCGLQILYHFFLKALRFTEGLFTTTYPILICFTFFAFAFSVFGSSIFKTPLSYFASIFSSSTKSTRLKLRENEP